jgi:hypothetical protein
VVALCRQQQRQQCRRLAAGNTPAGQQWQRSSDSAQRRWQATWWCRTNGSGGHGLDSNGTGNNSTNEKRLTGM